MSEPKSQAKAPTTVMQPREPKAPAAAEATPHPKDTLPVKQPTPLTDPAKLADADVKAGQAAGAVADVGAPNLRVRPNCFCAGYLAGDIFPREVLGEEADWHIAQGVVVETNEPATVKLPKLAKPPEDADAALVENKRLRAELNAARVREQQAANRDSMTAAGMGQVEQDKAAAEAKVQELQDANAKMLAEIEFLKKAAGSKQETKPGS